MSAATDAGALDAAAQSRLYAALRGYSIALLAAALVGAVFMVVQHEVALARNPLPPAGRPFAVTNALDTLNVLRAVGVTVPTGVALVLLYLFYLARLALMKTRNQAPPAATVLSLPALRWQFLVEAALLAVHVFPCIEDVPTPSAAGGTALYLIMMQGMHCRWIVLLKALKWSSSLNSPNGRFVSALTNVEFGSRFVLKTALREHPLALLSSLLAIVLFASAYAVRMVETLGCSIDESLPCAPMDLGDAMWLEATTALTVGAGSDELHTPGASRACTAPARLCSTAASSPAATMHFHARCLSRLWVQLAAQSP